MNIQECLDQAIKQVCPIDGVSFGKLDDKSTWRIDYTKEATEAQKIEAKRVVDQFAWDDATKEKSRKSGRNARYITDLLYRKAFKDYLILNPNASFGDFMDYLESQKI